MRRQYGHGYDPKSQFHTKVDIRTCDSASSYNECHGCLTTFSYFVLFIEDVAVLGGCLSALIYANTPYSLRLACWLGRWLSIAAR